MIDVNKVAPEPGPIELSKISSHLLPMGYIPKNDAMQRGSRPDELIARKQGGNRPAGLPVKIALAGKICTVWSDDIGSRLQAMTACDSRLPAAPAAGFQQGVGHDDFILRSLFRRPIRVLVRGER